MALLRTSEDVAKDAVMSLFLGARLGAGVAREVYEYGPAPGAYVVKVETDIEDRDFQCIAEWELWNNAPAALRKWLAPCIALSPCGRALMQARCEPCPIRKVPMKVPTILEADAHPGNFGLYQGRVVLLDYGRNLALTIATNARAQRAYERR